MGRIKALATIEEGDSIAVRLYDTDPPNLLAFGTVIETEDGFSGLVDIPYVGRLWLHEDCDLDLIETAKLRGWVDAPDGGMMPNPNRKIPTMTVHHARYKDAHPNDPTIPF